MRRQGAWVRGAVLVGVAILLWWGAAASAQVRAAHEATAADPLGVAIRRAHLAELPVRTAPTSSAEDLEFAQALEIYGGRTNPEDLSALSDFAARNPASGWAAADLTNLGLAHLHDGYYSQAIEDWRKAWALGRSATDPRAKAMVDRAVGELARLYANFGQFDRVSALFSEIGRRPISGSATESIQEARELLALTTKDPRHLFNCGPVGLKLLMLARNPREQGGAFLQWYRVGRKGSSLAELGSLAQKAGFPYRLVFRQPGQATPTSALMHWKLGHYSAIIGTANGRYHLKDPIFPGGEAWVTQAALDTEASGYFLLPANAKADPAWRVVDAREAAKVWGKGPTSGTQAGASGARDNPASGGGRGKDGCGGMCVYDIREATVGVTISDTPVGYAPSVGPRATASLTYNQREDSQPANFSFSNVSPKWTMDWLAYVTDDPANPGASVSRYLVGGGAYYYSGYDSGTGKFTADEDDGSVLVRTSGGTVSYQRQLSDGSVEIYAQTDGSTSYPRRVFLTQVVDPRGNAVTLNYDFQNRLASLTDATGRETKFSYALVNWPFLITQITDPFGRSAALSYDTQGRLASITDVIGLVSSFTYDANSLVNSMTTPYGTTAFAYTAPGTSGPPRFVDVTDPMGYHERVEWLEPAPVSASDPAATVPQGMPLTPTNNYLNYRDSFYWGRDAYVAAGCTVSGGCDYAKARATHYLHVANTSLKSTTVESIKYPLESRVWYSYPGQTGSIYTGAYGRPSALARVLDDGSTQIAQFSYDAGGWYKPTQIVDPIGRLTSLTYATNKIDLASISQLTAPGVQTTIAKFTYNNQHEPITATDAAGQTTTYTYNAVGQLSTATNALNQKTTYNYNSSGDLTSVVNANNATATAYTYDAFDRVATFTDSQGWTVSYSYDSLDRLTEATYPDGSSESYAYDKLDLASYQDRLGHTWTYTHDADRRLTAATDPTGHQTLFAYNGLGQITSRTDPNGHATQWAYDVEGRLTTKTYADNSTLAYGYEATTSRLKSTTDALSQVRQFGYAKDSRLTGITYVGAVNPTPNVTFSYDTYFPRLASRTDGAGTTQYTYVPIGSLGALYVQQEATPLANGTISYAYDQLGRISRRTVQGSTSEALTYDAIGRLTGDSNDLGAFTLGYLGQTGQITSRQLTGSSLATTWSYQPNSADRRLVQISTTGLSAGQSTGFQYASNAEDQTTGVTQTTDASITYPSAALTQTASYNNLNQLTGLSGQALTWDANGNLLSDGSRTYSWDAENRLVAIGYPGQAGKATTFAYDGLGRRVSIGSTPVGGGSAVTTSYVWCGLGPCQARDSSGAVLRAYYSEGEFVAGSPGQGLYYALDRVGSVRRVFAAGQAPAYDYDPYGVSLQGAAPVTDFAYAGLFYNADSGLYLANRRAYDPISGRWLSRDSIGEAGDPDGNLYGYVGGNPVGASDPSGLFASGPLFNALKLGLTEEAIGGGPEDPIADVAAAGTVLAGLYAAIQAPDRTPAPNGGGAGNGGKNKPPAPPGGPPCPPGSGGSGPGGNGPGSGGRGSGAGTNLFRAVSPAELQDLLANEGMFRNPFGIEGKYFSTTVEGAASYAQQTYGTGLYEGPYTIVQTSIPTGSITPDMQAIVDGGIPTVVVPTEFLPSLNPGSPLTYTPLPSGP